MIHGKIKKDLLNEFKNDLFIEITEDMNIISIVKFIQLLQEQTQELYELDKSLNLLDYISEYSKIASKNITISSQFIEIIGTLSVILKYYKLSKRRELLLKELELSEYYEKSRNKTTLTDLLNKLNESLLKNKNKLKFLEEDYLKQKNQITQTKNKIEEINQKIQELTNQKKQCFNQINRITRSMSENIHKVKQESNSIDTDANKNLTNAEKIRNIQKKAKEIQYEINKNKEKKNQIELKFNDLNPIFESYKNDYEKISEIINNDENRIKEIQIEIKKEIRNEEDKNIKDLSLVDLQTLKPLQVIKDDIEKVEKELDKILIPKEFLNPHNFSDISKIIQKLKELDEFIENHKSEVTIQVNEEEIVRCLEQFAKLEDALDSIESITNIFLSEVSLIAQFRFILNDNNQLFFLEINFIRTDENLVSFDELTTPEKIFVIIVFYISIKLYVKSKNIIFSNVSILSKYNKAGSIYRTIRKILPLFEKDTLLSGFNLIFILSNLELKKEIKNLKIKTIQET
ncbi:MAG: coiled-coil domain-containing protein [Promethearchaeota archaeon]